MPPESQGFRELGRQMKIPLQGGDRAPVGAAGEGTAGKVEFAPPGGYGAILRGECDFEGAGVGNWRGDECEIQIRGEQGEVEARRIFGKIPGKQVENEGVAGANELRGLAGDIDGGHRTGIGRGDRQHRKQQAESPSSLIVERAKTAE